MTEPVQDNIVVAKGDTPTFGITVEGQNITGWKFFFTAKKKLTDTDASAKMKIDITLHVDPVNGYTEFKLTTAHTDTVDTYYFSIRYVDTAGNIETFLTGSLKVSDHATIRSS